jgi:hypothetical protein
MMQLSCALQQSCRGAEDVASSTRLLVWMQVGIVPSSFSRVLRNYVKLLYEVTVTRPEEGQDAVVSHARRVPPSDISLIVCCEFGYEASRPRVNVVYNARKVAPT